MIPASHSFAIFALVGHIGASQLSASGQPQTSSRSIGTATFSSNGSDPCCFILGNPFFAVATFLNPTTYTQIVATVVQTLYQYPNSTSLGAATTSTVNSNQIFTQFGLFECDGDELLNITGFLPTANLLQPSTNSLGYSTCTAATSVLPASQNFVTIEQGPSQTITIPVNTSFNLWEIGIQTQNTLHNNGSCNTPPQYTITSYEGGSINAPSPNLGPGASPTPAFLYVEYPVNFSESTIPPNAVSNFIDFAEGNFSFVSDCYVLPSPARAAVAAVSVSTGSIAVSTTISSTSHLAVEFLTVSSTVTSARAAPELPSAPNAPTPLQTSPSTTPTTRTSEASPEVPQPEVISSLPIGGTSNAAIISSNGDTVSHSPTAPEPDTTRLSSSPPVVAPSPHLISPSPSNPNTPSPDNANTPSPSNANTPSPSNANTPIPSNKSDTPSPQPAGNSNTPEAGLVTSKSSQTVIAVIGGSTTIVVSSGTTYYPTVGGQTLTTVLPIVPGSRTITTVIGGTTSAITSGSTTYNSVLGGQTLTTMIPLHPGSQTIATVVGGTTSVFATGSNTFHSVVGGQTLTTVVPLNPSSQSITTVVGGTTTTFTSGGVTSHSVIGGTTITTILPAAASSHTLTAVLGGTTSTIVTAAFAGTTFVAPNGDTVSVQEQGRNFVAQVAVTISPGDTAVLNGVTLSVPSNGNAIVAGGVTHTLVASGSTTYVSVIGGSTVTTVVPVATILGASTSTFVSGGQTYTTVLGGSTSGDAQTSNGMGGYIMSGIGGQTQPQNSPTSSSTNVVKTAEGSNLVVALNGAHVLIVLLTIALL